MLSESEIVAIKADPLNFPAETLRQVCDTCLALWHMQEGLVTLRDKLQKRVRELEAALSKALAKTQCRKPQQRYDKRERPIVGWFDCGECDTCLARKELAVAKGEKAKP